MVINKLIKRFSVISLFILALLIYSANNVINAEESPKDYHWVATWGASPFAFLSFGNAAPPAPLKNQTVRQVVRISVGGDQLRVRFSNEIGDAPLIIGSASIALVEKESSIKPDSLRKLTFGGADSFTLPPGAPALSDPVNLSVDDLSEIAVTIYFPNETKASTVHMGRTAFTSTAGDFTQSIELSGVEKTSTLVFLSGIYVGVSEDTGVVVAFGDSITDGATLTPFEGTFAGYYTPEKDKIRMQVNEWIRTSGKFDAVIDFDKVIQDPDNPGRIAAAYDSGDKLHPGDAGYKKMAESIDLSLFE